MPIENKFKAIICKMRFKLIFARAKREILEDILKNIIPETISCFQDLHLYVDANCYGGFCEENYISSDGFEFENRIQTALDEWLKNNKK